MLSNNNNDDAASRQGEPAAGVPFEDASVDSQRHEEFGELFVRNQNRIYRYICSVIPNRADAEELFQQTNLTLWKTWDRYDPSREFVPWACGIAHNHIRNFLRKKQHKQVVLSQEIIEQLTHTRMENDELLEQRKQALAGCLKKLSPPQRDLIARCYASDQTIKQAAKTSGQTPNAIYKRLRRIRAALHDCISRSLLAGVHG
jgi:RNA polymerase sigma-70 factor (ECF subfamily)